MKKLKKHFLTKDLVIGLGQIGDPILKITSKGIPTIGYDVDPKLRNKKKYLTMCINDFGMLRLF